MTKEEIIKKINHLLFEETSHLSRKEYYDLLDDVGSSIDMTLDTLNAEDDRNMIEEEIN